MSKEILGGYSARVRALLSKHGVEAFSRVSLALDDGRVIEGIVLPRPEFGDPDVLVVKLDNGYNIGIDVDRVKELKLVSPHRPAPLVELRLPHLKPGLPKVCMVSTGGTIASRIDYKTGAVYPFFSAEEIYSMIPELEDLAFIKAETLFSIFSEDMTPQHWERLAERIYETFEREKPAGVVVAHGTDTMAYSAAAMAFALRDLPGPVVFVGAQRSSDRPSSDTALNVICAVKTAVEAPFGESVIVMHGSPSDDFCLVHRGVKARKCHTSRRDAFRSVNDVPLAVVRPGRPLAVTNHRYKPRNPQGPTLLNGFESKVALVKFYPGMSSELIEALVDKGYKGVVLEGTGLGHIATRLIPTVRRAVEEGVVIVMTSQCLWGRINMNVYRTGVELIKAGVVPAEDMLPETAYVKLSWVLAHTADPQEARRLMLKNMAFEINPRNEERYYPPVWWGVDVGKP